MSPQRWQKSSYCQEGDACVHISATSPTTVHMTESADTTRAVLTTGPAPFAALLEALKSGPFTTPG